MAGHTTGTKMVEKPKLLTPYCSEEKGDPKISWRSFFQLFLACFPLLPNLHTIVAPGRVEKMALRGQWEKTGDKFPKEEKSPGGGEKKWRRGINGGW